MSILREMVSKTPKYALNTYLSLNTIDLLVINLSTLLDNKSENSFTNCAKIDFFIIL